jgi:hypothetical protein
LPCVKALQLCSSAQLLFSQLLQLRSPWADPEGQRQRQDGKLACVKPILFCLSADHNCMPLSCCYSFEPFQKSRV